MRRTGLGLVVMAALAPLTMLGGCERKDPSGPMPAAGFPDCRSADLTLRRVSQDAKTSTTTYSFENRGATCVVRDHALITLTGPDGKPLELKQVNDSPPPELQRRAQKVVLRNQRRADFTVTAPTAKAGATCRPYVKLTATPPGSDWGLDAAEASSLCGGEIHVSTFWYDSSAVL